MNIPESIASLPGGAVRRLFEATNRHDIDALVGCFAGNYVNETPNHPGRSFTGRGQVRKNWTTLFAGVPDIRSFVVASATGANGRIWVEWGTKGSRPDGGPISMAGVVIFTVTADRIAAARFYLEPVDHGPGGVDEAVRSAVAGVPDGDLPGGAP
jgi:ketosteroid isomerase-like protein